MCVCVCVCVCVWVCLCVSVCMCLSVRVCARGLLRRIVNPSYVPKAGKGCLEGLAAAAHVVLPQIEEAVMDVAKMNFKNQFMYKLCLDSILYFDIFLIWQNGDMNTTRVK